MKVTSFQVTPRFSFNFHYEPVITAQFAVCTLINYIGIINQHITISYILVDNQISSLFDGIFYILMKEQRKELELSSIEKIFLT